MTYVDHRGTTWYISGAFQRGVVLPIDRGPPRQWREALLVFAAATEVRRVVTRAAVLGALVVLPPPERAALCARLLRHAVRRSRWLQASPSGRGQVYLDRPPSACASAAADAYVGVGGDVRVPLALVSTGGAGGAHGAADDGVAQSTATATMRKHHPGPERALPPGVLSPEYEAERPETPGG